MWESLLGVDFSRQGHSRTVRASEGRWLCWFSRRQRDVQAELCSSSLMTAALSRNGISSRGKGKAGSWSLAPLSSRGFDQGRGAPLDCCASPCLSPDFAGSSFLHTHPASPVSWQ